ncbi:hypothetical protein [Thomasclavelia ramosa]|nr:hypothetical protein [Thomasclavelia ramosa]
MACSSYPKCKYVKKNV